MHTSAPRQASIPPMIAKAVGPDQDLAKAKAALQRCSRTKRGQEHAIGFFCWASPTLKLPDGGNQTNMGRNMSAVRTGKRRAPIQPITSAGGGGGITCPRPLPRSRRRLEFLKSVLIVDIRGTGCDDRRGGEPATIMSILGRRRRLLRHIQNGIFARPRSASRVVDVFGPSNGGREKAKLSLRGKVVEVLIAGLRRSGMSASIGCADSLPPIVVEGVSALAAPIIGCTRRRTSLGLEGSALTSIGWHPNPPQGAPLSRPVGLWGGLILSPYTFAKVWPHVILERKKKLRLGGPAPGPNVIRKKPRFKGKAISRRRLWTWPVPVFRCISAFLPAATADGSGDVSFAICRPRRW